MITWLKYKYRVFKRRGRFESSHNDSQKKKRNKTGMPLSVHNPPPGEHVLVITSTGKRKWIWR